jgi:predicted DNA-binding transcriptional regulator AlpA
VTLHQFTIVVSTIPTAEQLDAIAEHHGDLGVETSPRQGHAYITVDRRTDSLAKAVMTAVRDVESVGLQPVRIEDDDSVTLGEVADRIGRSRETVRLWATGKQGPGGFPPPVNPGRKTLFYSWAEVAPWLRQQIGLNIPEVEPVLALANHYLRTRSLEQRVNQPDVEELRPLVAA